jgi:hypothetical protein
MGKAASRLTAPLDARTAKRALWVVIVAGVTARLVLAVGFPHDTFDMVSFRRVGHALRSDPLHVYEIVGERRWPYPPTFFPWVITTSWLADLGLDFNVVFRLPSIVADAVLALVVHNELHRLTRNPRIALAGGSLIALGPLFAVNSAYHGQIDSVAILPAVLGVIAWRRTPARHRAYAAGLLIGLGASVKTPAGLALLALLPLCGSLREVAKLVAATLAVPVVTTAAFLAAAPSTVLHTLTSQDVPGVGGLHLFTVVILKSPRLTGAVENHGTILLGVVMAAAFALLWARRPIPPPLAATLLWLGFHAAAPSFFFGYLVWGLPFFVLAGYLWSSAALMALTLSPQILFETGRGFDYFELYKWTMTATWFALIGAFIWLFVRILRGKAAGGVGEGDVEFRGALTGAGSSATGR